MGVQDPQKTTGPVVLAISGMTCGGCAGAVTGAFSAVPGVAEVRRSARPCGGRSMPSMRVVR
jgi:hypothetical protein